MQTQMKVMSNIETRFSILTRVNIDVQNVVMFNNSKIKVVLFANEILFLHLYIKNIQISYFCTHNEETDCSQTF